MGTASILKQLSASSRVCLCFIIKVLTSGLIAYRHFFSSSSWSLLAWSLTRMTSPTLSNNIAKKFKTVCTVITSVWKMPLYSRISKNMGTTPNRSWLPWRSRYWSDTKRWLTILIKDQWKSAACSTIRLRELKRQFGMNSRSNYRSFRNLRWNLKERWRQELWKRWNILSISPASIWSRNRSKRWKIIWIPASFKPFNCMPQLQIRKLFPGGLSSSSFSLPLSVCCSAPSFTSFILCLQVHYLSFRNLWITSQIWLRRD